MALPFILLIAIVAALIGFMYFRTGKQRGKSSDGGDGGGAFFSYDSDSHCNDSSGDCGGDGGGD